MLFHALLWGFEPQALVVVFDFRRVDLRNNFFELVERQKFGGARRAELVVSDTSQQLRFFL